MSRYIKCPDNQVSYLLDEVKSRLQNFRLSDGKFKFEYNIEPKVDNINICFSETAYFKMLALVTEFSTEVQWHGFVEVRDDGTYYVYDILVFPHEVDSATVSSSTEEYNAWINTLSDEDFYALRFHGHSHVNMSITPSSVDMQYRENLTSTIAPSDDNPFYIFMILNKSHSFNIEVFDIANNIIYTSNNINISVELGEDDTMEAFLAHAKQVAKRKEYLPPTTNFKTSDIKKKTNVISSKKTQKNRGSEDKIMYSYNNIYADEDTPKDCLECCLYKTPSCQHCYNGYI